MQENPIDDELFWHTALLPAFKLELKAYLEYLRFEAEYHLTTKPLQVDLLIIKKERNVRIDNPIARIFRGYNLVEYKSPAASLSIDEFYRTIVYVLLYKSIDRLDITDMTLSFIVTMRPNTVLGHIREVWKCPVTESENGICHIGGFPFPIQVIESKKLSKEDNVFLRNMNVGLDEAAVAWALRLGKEYPALDISAYVDIITRANKERMKEMTMYRKSALEEVVEEVGWAARWRAEGEARAKAEARREFAQKLIKKGWKGDEIAETTGLDAAAVDALLAEAGPQA